jgi:hypothetical protein
VLDGSLVVAVDVRAGRVVAGGWRRETGLTVEKAAERFATAGVSRILCTAVDRDGTLERPDLDLLARVCERSELPVLAAGGVRSRADLAVRPSSGWAAKARSSVGRCSRHVFPCRLSQRLGSCAGRSSLHSSLNGDHPVDLDTFLVA